MLLVFISFMFNDAEWSHWALWCTYLEVSTCFLYILKSFYLFIDDLFKLFAYAGHRPLLFITYICYK